MSDFPFLRPDAFRRTSPPTVEYNCIAWAADDNDNWWWPVGGYYWPATTPAEETIDAFVAAFNTLGYAPCEDGALEAGFEKVAIYATAAGTPTHMARQLASGAWTSKLGMDIDIEHSALRAVEGGLYGTAVKFLKRARRLILV